MTAYRTNPIHPLLAALALLLLLGLPAGGNAQPGLELRAEVTGHQPDVLGTEQTVEATITVWNRGLKTNYWLAVPEVPFGWQVANLTPEPRFIDNNKTRDFRFNINPGTSPGNYNLAVEVWAHDQVNVPRRVLTEQVPFEVIPPPGDFNIMTPQQEEIVSGIFNVSWSRPVHVDTYNLRIRRLQDGQPINPPVFQELQTPDRDFQLNADDLLEPGKYYRIDVEANNRAFSGVAAQNSPRRIRAQEPPPLGPFQFTAPASAGDQLSTSPQFSWTASQHAETYSVAVFPQEHGVMNPVPISFVEGIEGTSYTWEDPVLDGGVDYYVSVSAQGLGGSRVIDGGPRRFTATALGSFELISPNNNQNNIDFRPRFRWEPAPGAVRYDIVIFEKLGEGEGERVVINHSVPQQSGLVQYDVPKHRRLKHNTEYLWMVVAHTHNEYILNDGGGRSFTTIPMGGFGLLSPAPFETGADQLPTFEWEPTEGVFAYLVEIAEPSPTGKPDPDTIRRSPPVLDGSTELESPFDPLEIGKTYLWRVGATDSDVIVWNTPNWQPFTVGAVGEFDLAGPQDNAENVPVQPQFQWTAAENATAYRVHLWIDGVHEIPPIEVEGQVTGVDLLEKGIFLNGDQNYTWTAEAIGPGNTRMANGERTFKTTFREDFQSCDIIEHLLGKQKFSILDQQVSGIPRPLDISAYLQLLQNPDWESCEHEP